jgi:hypothetical protein
MAEPGPDRMDLLVDGARAPEGPEDERLAALVAELRAGAPELPDRLDRRIDALVAGDGRRRLAPWRRLGALTPRTRLAAGGVAGALVATAVLLVVFLPGSGGGPSQAPWYRSSELVRPSERAPAAALLASPSVEAAGARSPAGVVTTGGSPLRVRVAPRTAAAARGSVANGAVLALGCTARGDSVLGPHGAADRWYRLAGGGYVAGVFVVTGNGPPKAC